MWSSCCAYSRRRESPILGAPFTPFCFVGEGGPKYSDVAAASSILGRVRLSGLVSRPSRAGWSEVGERKSDILEKAAGGFILGNGDPAIRVSGSSLLAAVDNQC